MFHSISRCKLWDMISRHLGRYHRSLIYTRVETNSLLIQDAIRITYDVNNLSCTPTLESVEKGTCAFQLYIAPSCCQTSIWKCQFVVCCCKQVNKQASPSCWAFIKKNLWMQGLFSLWQTLMVQSVFHESVFWYGENMFLQSFSLILIWIFLIWNS